MTKICRQCGKEYPFCPSCILTRPYTQKYCSIKCSGDNKNAREANLKANLSTLEDTNKLQK